MQLRSPQLRPVFRDELSEMFPRDRDARRLASQTYLLSEFLDAKTPRFELPAISRRAVVQAHCHHSSVLGFDAETRIFERLGLDVEVPDSGCCGMAGAFGFEAGEHYEVSMRCAERVLLPVVHDAAADALVVTDGFSCREQIVQATGRDALHLAEVIAAAMTDQ